jgi:hypothetical protein
MKKIFYLIIFFIISLYSNAFFHKILNYIVWQVLILKNKFSNVSDIVYLYSDFLEKKLKIKVYVLYKFEDNDISIYTHEKGLDNFDDKMKAYKITKKLLVSEE